LRDLARFLQSLPNGRLTPSNLLCDETLIARDGNLTVHYVPFGYCPERARVALIGITPGFEQMRRAFEAARDLYSATTSQSELYRKCEEAAGFGCPMRKILVEMLNEVGIHNALNVSTSSALFDSNRLDVMRTSVLQHPVFVSGKNYTGHRPPGNRTRIRILVS
jgi:hypothetical protein